MCVGPNRLNEAAATLSFDYQLIVPIDRTYIITSYTQKEIQDIFKQFGLDSSKFSVISDDYFAQYYDLTTWSHDNWYKQQAFKLCAIDQFESEYFLIQDCDLILLEPYAALTQNKINFKCEDLWNPHQHVYGKMVSEILDIPRTLPVSLVNELMPVKKADWVPLKQRIETKYGKDFLSAIASVRAFDSTKWFSEYELLGMFKMFLDQEWTYFKRPSQPPIYTWDDFYNTDWTQFYSVKFHAPPLKHMTTSEALDVVKMLHSCIDCAKKTTKG